MGFTDDLNFGKDAEEQTLKNIRKKYPLAFIIEGRHKPYDIFVPEINAGVEVKCDRKSEDTGNIFIEIECNDEYSGLLTTTAAWLVYRTTHRVFYTKPENIKQFLVSEAQRLRMFNHTPKGETSKVRGYLIPVEEEFVPILNDEHSLSR